MINKYLFVTWLIILFGVIFHISKLTLGGIIANENECQTEGAGWGE